MFNKIGLIKELATKFGKRNTMDLVKLVESNEPFVVNIKIEKQGGQNKKEIIDLKDGQQVIIEYTEI